MRSILALVFALLVVCAAAEEPQTQQELAPAQPEGTQTQPPAKEGPPSPRDLVNNAYSAFAAGDGEAVIAFFANSVLNITHPPITPRLPSYGVHQGDAIRELFATKIPSLVEVNFTHTIVAAGEESVIVRVTLHEVKSKRTNKTSAAPVTDFHHYTFKDGKVVYAQFYSPDAAIVEAAFVADEENEISHLYSACAQGNHSQISNSFLADAQIIAEGSANTPCLGTHNVSAGLECLASHEVYFAWEALIVENQAITVKQNFDYIVSPRTLEKPKQKWYDVEALTIFEFARVKFVTETPEGQLVQEGPLKIRKMHTIYLTPFTAQVTSVRTPKVKPVQEEQPKVEEVKPPKPEKIVKTPKVEEVKPKVEEVKATKSAKPQETNTKGKQKKKV